MESSREVKEMLFFFNLILLFLQNEGVKIGGWTYDAPKHKRHIINNNILLFTVFVARKILTTMI